MLELQEKNRQLREEIRSHEEWAAERKHYERKQIVRATVYVREGEPRVHYCPHCFQAKKFHQLHYDGDFQQCSMCGGTFDAGI